MGEGVMAVVVPDQSGCVYISGVLPGIVGVGITLPLQEILQAFVPPEGPVVDDGFYFVLRLISHEVRWWSYEVGTVGRSFDVRG